MVESGEGECLNTEKGKKEKKKLTPSMKSSLDLTICTCGRTCSRKFSSCVKFFSPGNGSLNLELLCRQRDSESEHRKRVRKRVKLPQNLEVGREVRSGSPLCPCPPQKNGHRTTDT